MPKIFSADELRVLDGYCNMHDIECIDCCLNVRYKKRRACLIGRLARTASDFWDKSLPLLPSEEPVTYYKMLYLAQFEDELQRVLEADKIGFKLED